MEELLLRALEARLNDPGVPRRLCRLFNGFLEGNPALSVERFGETLVVYEYSGSESGAAWEFYHRALPELTGLVVKRRRGDPAPVTVSFSQEAGPGEVEEDGLRYAVNLQMHQDASLYLDARALRRWLRRNAGGLRVLNTFAYTGSLGVAALAGGAQQVVQTDLNPHYLSLGQQSYRLNGFPVRSADFQAGDFFKVVAGRKGQTALFDCVILDAPYFSSTAAGRVDLNRDFLRLVNKVRPLIADGGRLVAVNNALYLPGAELMQVWAELCRGGYMELEERLEIEADCAGYPQTRRGAAPADPAPYNHSTKITVLRLRRKDGRK